MAALATLELTIARPEGLDAEQLRRCAGLVHDAGCGYYDLVDLDRDLLEAQIAKQLGQRDTELERTFVALAGAQVAGLYCCVSTAILPEVMMAGTLQLLRGLDPEVRMRFLQRLRGSRPSLPALPEESLYLARVAVAPDFRGRGVGESLMQDYLGRRYTEKSYCLHCLADNSRAHRFFQRWGFEPWGEAKGGFLAMVRAMD